MEKKFSAKALSYGLPVVEQIVEADYTHQEIADKLGLGGKMVVRKLLERSRMKAKSIPKQRGRKLAKTLQEYKYENKRVKMEVELPGTFSRTQERSEGQRQV